MTWEEFQQKKAPFSVALDGYVIDSTQRNSNGPYANFDHHSHVDRISTRSTAEQIHLEINLGLFDTFRVNGKPYMDIYVNDPDEDTTTAVWLLMNHERVTGHADPLINKLVFCGGLLDCTAGSYPFGETQQLRKMEWIFEPYRKARHEGRLSQMGESEMRTIFEAVLARITEYSLGNGGANKIEGKYEVLGGGPGWSLVKETGTTARMHIYASGIPAFVSVLSEGRYVIGRRSTWVPFPIEKIYRALNDAEGKNVWGGSNTVGGCSRGDPSGLTTKQVVDIVNAEVER
jgi:hypothetical protein